MPMERRMRPSVMPISSRSCAETEPCVVVAECDASDSTPPNDSALRKILMAPRKRAAFSREPMSKLIMEPKPFCCLTARSYCMALEARVGELADLGMLRQEFRDGAAVLLM